MLATHKVVLIFCAFALFFGQSKQSEAYIFTPPHRILLYENGKRITDHSVYLKDYGICQGGTCTPEATHAASGTFYKLDKDKTTESWRRLWRDESFAKLFCAAEQMPENCHAHKVFGYGKQLDEYRLNLAKEAALSSRDIAFPEPEFHGVRDSDDGGRYAYKTFTLDISSGKVRVLAVDGVPVWYRRLSVIIGMVFAACILLLISSYFVQKKLDRKIEQQAKES